ncbi:MAG: prepilin-type N-terminal cleavage/methylation domain-containing protein, partial [Ramlibacter sp.]
MQPFRVRGFTLVELLVALFAMALLAVMSWRGLDGMTRAQTQTQTRADDVLVLQIGLAQWAADLDALIQLPQFSALDWNGRVLRLTRRGTDAAASGVFVVAWTRRSVDGTPTWLRWQSPPLSSRGQVDEAWQKADIWAQNPGDEQRRFEVAITPLEDWKIFYYRSDAWTNPLSSDATARGLPAGLASATAVSAALIPDGVRLVLTLPPGHALSGTLTRDWVRPT